MTVSIAQAINGTLTLITVGRAIYEAVASYMDSMESSNESGVSKKALVLAKAKELILNENKWDKWESYISQFIDAAKSIYNSLKGIFF